MATVVVEFGRIDKNKAGRGIPQLRLFDMDIGGAVYLISEISLKEAQKSHAQAYYQTRNAAGSGI
jgi:hypothetical protein